MSENLTEKTVAIKLESAIPLKVYDDQGQLIGSALIEGCVGVTIIIDKHHPAALNLETENGLANLKLSAQVENNVIDGNLTIGG